ncbi:hypothetical protein [Kineosporia sp. R_H_3]|uniref:hypothetical protein n=1 Tax=Kineosporia sp. R_H_3 TaxID=1961848 RepID=UPI0013045CF5|nr:hypothetical protein [Kineosporia sp. R_H_3]
MGRPPGSFVVSAAFLGLFAVRAWGPAPDLALLQGLLCVVMVLGAVAVRAGRVGAWVALGAATVTVVVGGAVWALTGLWVPGTIAAAWAAVAAFGVVSASRVVPTAAPGGAPVPGGRRSTDPDPLAAPWPHPAQRVPDHLAPPAPGAVPDGRRYVPAYNAATGGPGPVGAVPSPTVPAPMPAPVPPPAPAPAFASSAAVGAAPQFATAAPRATLSSLRTTSVSSLQGLGSTGTGTAAGRSAPDGPPRFGTLAPPAMGRGGVPAPAAGHSPGGLTGGDRVWGSPAAPGSAAQVLPGARGGRRRRGRTSGSAAPVPGQRLPVGAQQPAGTAAAAAPADAVITPPPPAPAPAPTPARATAPATSQTPAPAAAPPTAAQAAARAAAPAPEGLEPLTRRPGDPQVGPALLGPARARIRELEGPLLTSWLAALAAGERGEPAAPLSPGQVAVLAAACEDPSASARLLDAVTDPVTHADRAARAARAAALLHLVARSTAGTDAQAAVLRTLDSVHTF